MPDIIVLLGGINLPVKSALDIGTNSVRLLVAEVAGGRAKHLYTGLYTTRLGEGMYPGGLLQREPLRRTTAALAAVRDLLQERCWPPPRVVATSAAREALNARELVKEVAGLGWRLEVLSGEEEAALSYHGATAGLALTDAVVLDIGGGSTEIAWRGKGRLSSYSLPLGAVRCTAAGTSRAEMRQVLQPILLPLLSQSLPLVGVGGTITTLAAVSLGLAEYDPERVHGFLLTAPAVHQAMTRLSGLPLEERRLVPGLQPERADIILAGIEILLAIMEELEAVQLYVSEADLLYALVTD